MITIGGSLDQLRRKYNTKKMYRKKRYIKMTYKDLRIYLYTMKGFYNSLKYMNCDGCMDRILCSNNGETLFQQAVQALVNLKPYADEYRCFRCFVRPSFLISDKALKEAEEANEYITQIMELQKNYPIEYRKLQPESKESKKDEKV